MGVRLTRAERREQIRTDLIASAREVFLRRGFHQASLEEIAAEAGWSKGAVFSNFAGKDDLFLAVVEEHNRRRRAEQIEMIWAGGSLAGGLRTVGRQMAAYVLQDPAWTPLLIEFWTHASRHEQTRARASAAHEDLLDGLALTLAEMAAHDGLEFVVPAKQVVRSAASLARGLTIEQLLDPESVSDGQFEDLFSAHILSFTRSAAGANASDTQG